ncbi:hypothetical protein OV142_14055 [Nannocystis sp. SCPEA4]|nr:hypothetical protein [Nannocystis sp. SCPEA4]
MNKTHLHAILSVTHGGALTDGQWQEIVGEILTDLSLHLGEAFEVDPDPDLFDAGFSLWLFSKGRQGASTQTVWSGVLTGRVIDPDWFSVEFAQFLFNPMTRSRIRDGKGAYLVHWLSVKGEEPAIWRTHGWVEDEYDEWEGVQFPDREEIKKPS